MYHIEDTTLLKEWLELAWNSPLSSFHDVAKTIENWKKEGFEQIDKLTLLLLYLTSFKEDYGLSEAQRSWKGYPFESLNII